MFFKYYKIKFLLNENNELSKNKELLLIFKLSNFFGWLRL